MPLSYGVYVLCDNGDDTVFVIYYEEHCIPHSIGCNNIYTQYTFRFVRRTVDVC